MCKCPCVSPFSLLLTYTAPCFLLRVGRGKGREYVFRRPCRAEDSDGVCWHHETPAPSIVGTRWHTWWILHFCANAICTFVQMQVVAGYIFINISLFNQLKLIWLGYWFLWWVDNSRVRQLWLKDATKDRLLGGRCWYPGKGGREQQLQWCWCVSTMSSWFARTISVYRSFLILLPKSFFKK